MSYAQASALRTHLQTLTDSGASITAYPDAADLLGQWGATEWTMGTLVRLVRENCPQGYIVPFVCKFTDDRLIMAKGNGHLFTYAVAALMFDLKYCRTRIGRISRNLRNLAVGFPANSAFRRMGEDLSDNLNSMTNSTGVLTLVINQLPLMARRATRVEQQYLHDLALEFVA